jgi:hypothetical protein
MRSASAAPGSVLQAFVLALVCAPPALAAAQQPAAPASGPPSREQAQPAPPPPTGPAQIINRAGRARAARELEQAATRGQPQTPAQPPASPSAVAASQADPQGRSAPAAAADPHGPTAPAAATTDPNAPRLHAGMNARAPQAPLASERADADLPAGTIRVQVHAPDGVPARDTEVSLGIMASDGSRSTETARTAHDGVAVFAGLASGERQAYRVNVPYRGAKYSSNPFRLPPSGGYQVEIRQLPVTRDEKLLVLYLGATSLELKDERLHVVQQARLLNLGGATYVFPEDGALVRLPEGFMAVQTQETMTDQRVVEAEGAGLRVHGSLLPGEVTLVWGFDLPLSGSELRFAIDIPWVTFAYRVIADAPPGLSLDVEGMPKPLLHSEGGRRFLITEMQRRIGDPPFQRLALAIHGIPGPGPGRWIAAALALIAIAAGVVLSGRAAPPEPRAAAQQDAALAARRAELLARARELQALRAAGETGPEYHQEQMALLTDELAALLFEEAESARPPAGAGASA